MSRSCQSRSCCLLDVLEIVIDSVMDPTFHVTTSHNAHVIVWCPLRHSFVFRLFFFSVVASAQLFAKQDCCIVSQTHAKDFLMNLHKCAILSCGHDCSAIDTNSTWVNRKQKENVFWNCNNCWLLQLILNSYPKSNWFGADKRKVRSCYQDVQSQSWLQAATQKLLRDDISGTSASLVVHLGLTQWQRTSKFIVVTTIA